MQILLKGFHNKKPSLFLHSKVCETKCPIIKNAGDNWPAREISQKRHFHTQPTAFRFVGADVFFFCLRPARMQHVVKPFELEKKKTSNACFDGFWLGSFREAHGNSNYSLNVYSLFLSFSIFALVVTRSLSKLAYYVVLPAKKRRFCPNLRQKDKQNQNVMLIPIENQLKVLVKLLTKFQRVSHFSVYKSLELNESISKQSSHSCTKIKG